MRRKYQRSCIALAVASAFAGTSTLASAAGFALIEQSASGLGNAFAGAAAAAEDASTIYYNPAGMSLLSGPNNVSTGLAFINLSAKFSDAGSQPSGTALAGINPAAARPLGDTGGNAGGLSAVPNFYFAQEIAP